MSVSWEESVEVLGATYREGSGLCLQAFLHGAHQALTEKTGLSPEKESLQKLWGREKQPLLRGMKPHLDSSSISLLEQKP